MTSAGLHDSLCSSDLDLQCVLYSRGVRVNAIAPGPTETNIATNLKMADNVESLPFGMDAMIEVPMA